MSEVLNQGANPVAALSSGHPGTAQAWAARINASWRRSFETVIETGRLLIDAKAHLAQHGAWENMLQDDLDFSPSTAQRLMIVARDNRLTNPAHVQLLPRSYGTLYELTKLTDDEFALGVDKGIIGPDMERKDVELIRPTPHRGAPDSSEESQAKATEGKAGMAGVDDPVRRSTAGTGLRVGEASADLPATSEHMDVTAGETAPHSMPRGGLAIAHRREEGDGREFFPTPPWATRAFFEHVLAHLERRSHCKFQIAWEPACGEGHMAEVLKEFFREVAASDVRKYDYRGDDEYVDFDCDFLQTSVCNGIDWIITNPPFKTSTDFVLKAIELAGTGVAMFTRLAWIEGTTRYERLFKDQPPTLISIFTERVPLHKGRWESDGNTFTAYAWLVWLKGAEPRAPFWIPPGCREALTKPDDVKRFGKSLVEEDEAA